jgi:glycerophosphoryl diester phosphodiesterase
LSTPNKKAFCVVAHRGDCAHAPENTFPAFELAVQKKADAIETDVRLTMDGVAVLLHDASLKRTTGCDELIENLTWEELRKLDASYRHGERFKNTRVPRLDEFVESFLPKIRLQIEIKAEAATLPTIEVLRRHNAFDRVLLTCFESGPLKIARETEPRLSTGWLLDRESKTTVEEVKALGCSAMLLNSSRVTEDLVKHGRDAGLLMWAWAVNDLDAAARVIQAGVDGATYDDPAALLSFLGR